MELALLESWASVGLAPRPVACAHWPSRILRGKEATECVVRLTCRAKPCMYFLGEGMKVKVGTQGATGIKGQGRCSLIWVPLPLALGSHSTAGPPQSLRRRPSRPGSWAIEQFVQRPKKLELLEGLKIRAAHGWLQNSALEHTFPLPRQEQR